eukprot:4416494-Pleurochrysis_carterae.AAC.1
MSRLVLPPPHLALHPSASIAEASVGHRQPGAAQWTHILNLVATTTLMMTLGHSFDLRNLTVAARWVYGELATPGWEKEEVMVEKDLSGDAADALLD